MVSPPEIADAGGRVEKARSLANAWDSARRGDAAARAELAAVAHEVARHELAARRVAPADAEDLAQEAVRSFLSYLAGPGEVPAEIRAFLKWRALGVLSDHRKRRRSRAMETAYEDPPEPTVEHPGPIALAVAGQVREALADCRARLAPDARAVLALRYEGGLDAGGIAAQLGVTRNAIHVRTFRALAALRECLVKKGIDPEDAP
ncbi:MAG: sigma-70 family RNA polymerase sigma factor [Planctomycetota bacterium]|nr:sigma-70 family RNA polymerase sigma factor [Planctomycetota bacterium]